MYKMSQKFAIVGIGGKQFRVKVGDTITTEKVAAEAGKTISLNHIFLLDRKSVV